MMGNGMGSGGSMTMAGGPMVGNCMGSGGSMAMAGGPMVGSGMGGGGSTTMAGGPIMSNGMGGGGGSTTMARGPMMAGYSAQGHGTLAGPTTGMGTSSHQSIVVPGASQAAKKDTTRLPPCGPSQQDLATTAAGDVFKALSKAAQTGSLTDKVAADKAMGDALIAALSMDTVVGSKGLLATAMASESAAREADRQAIAAMGVAARSAEAAQRGVAAPKGDPPVGDAVSAALIAALSTTATGAKGSSSIRGSSSGSAHARTSAPVWKSQPSIPFTQSVDLKQFDPFS